MSQPTSIAEWLTSVGMPEYATRFAENDIDVSVLGPSGLKVAALSVRVQLEHPALDTSRAVRCAGGEPVKGQRISPR